ncbi:MAG: hypothetical protein ABI444_08360 [Candidatus Kapaibacterium sp.]|jgi:hypothetical protein
MQKRVSRLFIVALSLGFLLLVAGEVFAQTKSDVPPAPVPTLVKNVYFMPYVTGSGNFHSGEAFPKSASGLGYGFGLAFDLTEDGQKTGFYFDFAFQDMRAAANDGSCMTQRTTDSLLSSVRAEHYFRYAMVETFVKLQGAKSNGYFLLGASFGYATTALTFSRGLYRDEPVDWKGVDNFNPFRLDIRAGLGVILANIGKHKLILEARVGYPITNAITGYRNICTGNGIDGNWKIITLQANLGLRL